MERLSLSHRPPTSCNRGPEKLRPKLHLRYTTNERSVLALPLASGAICLVPLAARYTRFLFSLVEAWREDDDEIEALRGFSTKAQISKRLTELSPTRRIVDPETVSAYVYEIRNRIAEALAKLESDEGGDHPPPALLENQRGLGYRIGACGLDVVRSRPSPNITD